MDIKKYSYKQLQIQYNHGHELGTVENYSEKHTALLTVGKMIEEINVSKSTIRHAEIIWKGCKKELSPRTIPQNTVPELCHASLELQLQ